MLINREQLITHLQRLSCEGLLGDVVLHGQFAGAGATIDRTVFIAVGSIPKVDPLPNEVGITNLDLLIKVLGSMQEDEIALTVTERSVEVGAHDRNFKLVTSSPKVIGTRIDDDLKGQILSMAGQEYHPLEHRFVEGVVKAQSILKASVLTLQVNPTGSTLVVGDVRLNAASFDLPEFKAAEAYSLLLSAEKFIPVLKQLKDFTKAQMSLSGPDSVIAVREGDYLYVVSPDKPESDQK